MTDAEDRPTASVFFCGTPVEPCATCKFSVRSGIKCEYELGGARKGHRCGRYSCRSCGRRIAEKDYCAVHASVVEKDMSIPKQPAVPHVILRFATAHIDRANGPAVYEVQGSMAPPSTDCPFTRGRPFAPSWALWKTMLADLKAGKEEYRREMLASYKHNRASWNKLLAEHRATIVCVCRQASTCHRVWLAEFLVKLGATYTGEL